MADAQLLRCPHCREQAMRRVADEPHPDGQLFLEFYACPPQEQGGCGKKVALWWELTGAGLTEAQQTWVEREVERRGSFFPGDYR